MRYFISLSYDGSGFCGWQSQPDARTVQDSIEKALSALLRCRIRVTGAGRTDTGVNACGYAAHFDFEGPLDTAQICYKLNAILPREIAVHGLRSVGGQLRDAHGAEYHARFSAVRREYTYFLHTLKDPFTERYSLLYTFPLDFDAMNRAAAKLVGTHDFSCFQKVGSDTKSSICTVEEAFWKPYTPSHIAVMGTPAPLPGQPETDSFRPSPANPDGITLPFPANPDSFSRPSPANPGSFTLPSPAASGGSPCIASPVQDYWYFRISADRFLRNMVRAVVGSLLDVGRGKRSIEDFTLLLSGGSRCDAGESVPGRPLFLSKVKY